MALVQQTTTILPHHITQHPLTMEQQGCQPIAEKNSALNVMEMDMSNTMEELDAMAKGIKNLSIRTKSAVLNELYDV